MKKAILYSVLLILVFLAGMWMAKSIFSDKEVAIQEATLLEQQVRKVSQNQASFLLNMTWNISIQTTTGSMLLMMMIM